MIDSKGFIYFYNDNAWIVLDSLGNTNRILGLGRPLSMGADDRIYGLGGPGIIIYSTNGQQIGQWALPESADAVCAGFDGLIHVGMANGSTNAIRVYDTAGTFLRAWGQFGEFEGQVNGPIVDLDVAPDGTTYIC